MVLTDTDGSDDPVYVRPCKKSAVDYDDLQLTDDSEPLQPCTRSDLNLTDSEPLQPRTRCDLNLTDSEPHTDVSEPMRPLRKNGLNFSDSDDLMRLEDSVPVQPRRKYDLNFTDTDPPTDEPVEPVVPVEAAAGSFASTQVRPTSRNKCLSTVNAQRRERYAERILLTKAMHSGSDKLLCEVLKTKVGRLRMPLCADSFGSQKHFDLMVKNTTALLQSTGRRYKKQVTHLLINGLPTWFCKNNLKLTAAETKRGKEEDPVLEGRGVEDASYAEHVTRDKINEVIDAAFKNFYERTTYQCSGAKTEQARIMDKPLYEWEAELAAMWPSLLREIAEERPQLVPALSDTPKSGWSDFEACLLSAVHSPPVDPVEEQTLRTQDFKKDYVVHLARMRGALPRATEQETKAMHDERAQRTASRLHRETYDPHNYSITAPSLRTLRLWLDRNNMRFTRFSVPHPCPLCTKGPSDEVVFTKLAADMAALKTAGKDVPRELQQRCDKLRASLRIYRVHCQQLETARKEAKHAEDNLAVGSCMVIRDFVNHHDHGGKHVKCLHWVLMWRDAEGEPLKRLKLRHYCSDPKTMSTDGYYQADVMDFHLNEENKHCPLLFAAFNVIYFVGDHGVHFACHDTMHNESTVWRKYGKEIKLLFLASYHAYSRADASGSQDSSALRRDLRAGLPRFGATAMKDMTNDSHDVSSWGYEMPAINRNKDVFPPDKHFRAKSRAKWIRKWCEVRFTHPNKSPRNDGILQYRLVTGVGPWQWTDLVAYTRTPAEQMCDPCSTKADAMVLHEESACPSPSYIHDLPQFEDLLPDPARINGPQNSKDPNKKGKGTTFPCKIADCERVNRKAFRKPATANRHMLIAHKLTEEQFAELGYPVADVEAAPDGEAAIDGEAAPAGDKDKAGGASKKKRPGRPKKAQVCGANTRKRAPDMTGSQDNSSETGDHEEDSYSEDHYSPTADENDNEVDDNDDSDDVDEDDDPDEIVDVGEDNYVMDAILKHRTLNSGVLQYRVSWVNCDTVTWEPASSLHRQTVQEYHDNLVQVEIRNAAAVKEKRKDAEEAFVAQGGSLRQRRRRDAPVDAGQNKALLDARANALQVGGMRYWAAYEKAEAELAQGELC
jgi:hypothetical protein